MNINNMNTPETDAACGYALTSHYGPSKGIYLSMDKRGPFVHTEVARKLERERNEAQDELENMKAAYIHTCHDQCQRPMCVLRRENEELKQVIKTLKKCIRYDNQKIDRLENKINELRTKNN